MNHSNLSEADREALEVQAKEYLEEAKRLKQQNKFQLSIDVAKQAATLHQELEMWEECVESRVLVASLLYAIGTEKSKIFQYLDETQELALLHLGEKHPLLALIFRRYGVENDWSMNPKMAREYYLKAIEIREVVNGKSSPQVGFLYGLIGTPIASLGEYEKSIEYFKKGIAILTTASEECHLGHEKNLSKWDIEKKRVVALTFYGALLTRLSFFEKALPPLNQALDICLKNRKSKDRRTAFLYFQLGVFYQAISDMESALLYFKKNLDLSLSLYGENHFLVVKAKKYNAMVLMDMEAYEEALPYVQDNVVAYKGLSFEGDVQLADSYHVLSKIYMETQDYKQALIYAQKSYEITSKFPDDRWALHLARDVFSFGSVHECKEEYEKALVYYYQALNKCIGTRYAQSEAMAYMYRGIGRVLDHQNKHLPALDSIQKSLLILCPKFQKLEVYQNPNLEDISTQMLSLDTLLLKAKAFFHYYQKNTQNIKAYEAALASFQLVDEVVCRLRKSYHFIKAKLRLSAKIAAENYSKGIYAAFNAPSSVDKTDWAFGFSEKAKATALYDSLQESMAKASSNIPNELLQKEKDVKLKLVYLDKRIQQQKARKINEEEISFKQTQNEFFDLHRQYIELIQNFEQNYPDYYQLKYQTETVSIEEIQASLADNQWMVSYFIGEKHYYIFLIGKEEFEVLDLEKINGFEQLVEDFLSAIQNHKLEEYTQKGYELYQELLQPLEMYLIDPSMDEEDSIQQLIVIPHGILHYLSLEALICTRPKSSGKVYVANEKEENTTNPYQSLDYALLHFEVSYHYSATLWHYLLSKQGERAPTDANSFVGFAPVYQSKSQIDAESFGLAAKQVGNWANRSEALRSDGTWTPLPYSKLEVEGIANLFAQKGLSAQAFLHEQATKQQFREVVAKSRFLLIAAHGVANDEQPKLSGLVFFPTVDGGRQTVDGAGISNTEHPIPNSESPISNNESRTTNNEPLITNNQSPITNNQHDCILSMEETYHLDLKADLVVLSSCESGIGELAKGEGMMAVNRGFLYAGAKNVVSTLFKVYDKPSSLLTQYLFEGVLEGKGYTEALRVAKLRLLKMEEVDVKSWCGFVLIGGD